MPVLVASNRNRPRPVYWKPSIPTRVMRERAFARRSLERERILRATTGSSLWSRVTAKLGRGR